MDFLVGSCSSTDDLLFKCVSLSAIVNSNVVEKLSETSALAHVVSSCR